MTEAAKSFNKNRRLILTALFSAIVVVLAFTPFIGYIPLGVTKATTIHIPVIIGSILLGPKCGAILGGVFGLTSLINNTIAPTVTSFCFSPFYTIGVDSGDWWKSLIICFIPRILVGVVPYYVYILVKKLIGKYKAGTPTALVLAGICGSMTNTLLVMNLIYFLFGSSYANAKDIAFETLYGVILGVIGVNGVPEAVVAAILAAVIAGTLMKTKAVRCMNSTT